MSGWDLNASTCSSSPAQILLTSDLLIPDSIPSAATRSSTALVETPFTDLHHHRIQGLVDPPPRLQDRREERAPPQLRDPQLHIAGLATSLGRDPFWSVTRLGALIAAGADALTGFGLDQLLHDQTDRLANQVHALAGTEGPEQLGCDRPDNAIGRTSSVSTCRYTPRIPVRGLDGPPIAAHRRQMRTHLVGGSRSCCRVDPQE
jgi:hypothetical protein